MQSGREFLGLTRGGQSDEQRHQKQHPGTRPDAPHLLPLLLAAREPHGPEGYTPLHCSAGPGTALADD